MIRQLGYFVKNILLYAYIKMSKNTLRAFPHFLRVEICVLAVNESP